MAAHILVIRPHNTYPNHSYARRIVPRNIVQCVTGDKMKQSNMVVERRSADYKPCIWDKEYLQTIHNEYVGKAYQTRAQKIMGDVKMMMKSMVISLDQLELIHVLQRLGVAYHFEKEISKILENIYNSGNNDWDGKDLHETALQFRILRQHGFYVSQDVFKRFFKDDGSFDKSNQEDVKGILSLYEASYYCMYRERIMEEAWVFTSKHLKELMKSPTIFEEQNISTELVRHALNMPLHWRMTRLEARWYIDVYEREVGMNPTILELAKLDFNIAQAFHQKELRELSRRWKKLGLGERLNFARDRLVEAYLWAIGTTFLPQDRYCREVITISVAILTILDDIYDVYGTLAELVLFTKSVERWDIKSIDELPDYMKISFLALFNMVNEMVYDILREHNIDVLPHLKKAWQGLLAKYLQEAKWYHMAHKPTLEEYMNNSWISVGSPLVAILAYVSATKAIEKEALEFLESGPEIVRFSSTIFRLCDDLGNSWDELKRGDVPKAIQCHMYDTGFSEEVSREHMRELIRQTWKKVNSYRVAESPVPKPIVEMILNMTRTSHIMYQNGNGHTDQEGVTTNIELSLLIEPISV